MYTIQYSQQLSGFLPYLLHVFPTSFYFAKMPYSKSQTAYHFTPNSVCVNKNYRNFISQPQHHYHTSQIENNFLVSCNTQAIIKLSQLSQRCLFTVGLFKTGSKLGSRILFNYYIVFDSFNLEHCPSLIFFTPLTCNLVILKEFKQGFPQLLESGGNPCHTLNPMEIRHFNPICISSSHHPSILYFSISQYLLNV